jgi:hypothetical protein
MAADQLVCDRFLILDRLRALNLRIVDAVVESRDTSRLPAEQRRLAIPGESYPLTIHDATALRKKISGAQAKVGRQPGARGGGNRTKRVRIWLDGVGDMTVEALRASLQRGD